MDIPIDHLKMNLKHNLSELREGLEGVMVAKAQAVAGSTTAIVNKTKIQKVPAVLLGRKGMKKHFEPRWISFGPIHYGNSKFKVAEKYKLELVAKFLRDGGYSSANELYDKIESEMTGVKGCFDEDVIQHFDDEDLKWILFYDGCVILQFINSCFKKDHLKELKIKNDQVPFIQHDLFLLENQIPYQVLEVLLNHSMKEKTDELQKSLNEFIEEMNVMGPGKNYRSFNIAEIETNSEPAHLLDIVLLAHLPRPAAANRTTGREYPAPRLPITNKETDDVKELTNVQILHNFLGSREQVADLFRTIVATPLLPNTRVNEVIIKIQRYHKNKWIAWIAQNISLHLNYYFNTRWTNTPWSGMTFISVAVALFLTATQTWFTVNPLPGPCDNFCQNLRKS